MTLSIIMPFRGPDFYETRWANYMWLRDRYDALLPDVEFIMGHNDDEPFNRSQARNNAVRASAGDVLLIADADTVFHEDQITDAIEMVEDGAPWVIAYGLGRYYNLTETASKAILAMPAGALVPEPLDPEEWEHKLNSWAGLLVVPRAAYEAVGGYDERFIGWGGEDNAFQIEMDRHCGVHQRVDHYALHLWHPRGEADFTQPHWPHNRSLLQSHQYGTDAQ